MSSNETDINPKQAAFIDNVLSGMSRTQAAIKAGFATEPNYGGVAAHRLIRNPKIRARIQQRIEEAISVTDEEIIGTLTSHMRGNINDILEPNGNVDLTAIESKGLGHLIKKIETKTILDGRGKDKVPVIVTKVELYNAQTAAEKLARIRGMDNHPQKIEHSFDDSGIKEQLTIAMQNALNAGMLLEDAMQHFLLRGVKVEQLQLVDGNDLVFPDQAIDIESNSDDNNE